MRSAWTLVSLATLFSAGLASANDGQVWKSPTCGCCKSWVSHMAANGFALDAHDVAQEALAALKAQNGISPKVASCHTAKIGGYTVEGHVPASAVKRLLAEKPDAIGLAVPGMPAGSPGMETQGEVQAYDVLLIKKDSSPEVFQHVEP